MTSNKHMNKRLDPVQLFISPCMCCLGLLYSLLFCDILSCACFCSVIQTTKRKGWINHSIKGPESIADHMYRMALMALIAGDLPAVDRERSVFFLFKFP